MSKNATRLDRVMHEPFAHINTRVSYGSEWPLTDTYARVTVCNTLYFIMVP